MHGAFSWAEKIPNGPIISKATYMIVLSHPSQSNVLEAMYGQGVAQGICK